MRCIQSPTGDPYFNLAAEEYLMKQGADPVYFQYINNDSVVVGKHQNALAEIDLDYLEENDIILARRISGGGAVYHDRGNLNFAFFTNENPGSYIQFKKYTAHIIAALRELGVEARLGERNEILVGDQKISGTASHIFKDRVLHHGTLLYDADLGRLGRCLYVSRERFSDKAVRSVRSEVTNIRSLLKEELTMEEFSDFIFSYILESVNDSRSAKLVEEEVGEISMLRAERFIKWDWNYGYSPKYEIDQEVDYWGRMVRFKTLVVKGMIAKFEVEGDPGTDAQWLDHLLMGRQHDRARIWELLKGEGLDYDILRRVVQGLF
jgi:lipoate-protein ligase A